MNFKEIIDLAYNIIDEVDYDEQVEIIVKNAINEAYKELGKLDKRLDTAYIPVIRKVATLPDNCVSVIECTPALGEGDRFVGNAIITQKTGTLELIYATAREQLIEDEDVPDLHEILLEGLSLYACYKYFMHRKKGDVANGFLNRYMLCQSSYSDMQTNMSCVMDAVVIEY